MDLSGTLKEQIEYWFAQGTVAIGNPEAEAAFVALRRELEAGRLRAAEPDSSSLLGWQVNAWVKRGILLGFRIGTMMEMGGGTLGFIDKHTYPVRRFVVGDGVRVVPGGVSVRSGAYVAQGVAVIPPSYVNVGAYVDEGTMVDSHALVGSCAQVGKRVHLSAAAQIGGNTGVYEGTIVRKRAVLAAGTVLTRGTPVYDLVKGEIYKASGDLPLIIPEGAVVVPGSRSITKGKGAEWGLSLAAPVIVKYRDEKTELSLVLEDILR